MKNILFLDQVHQNLRIGLEKLGWKCVEAVDQSIEDVSSMLPDFHGIVIRSRVRLDKAILDKAEKLEFIARSGAGMENIDVEYCKIRGIHLFNAPEGNRQAVAEHALGMLLALSNRLIISDNQVRQGIWDREGNRGIELSERTVGIIGYGNNGSNFARVLSGIGCKVIAYDKYKKGFASDSVEEVSLEAIQKRADVLSFHIPQNSETMFMFNDVFLEEMEKSFYLINLSRGKIVKTSVLVRGLESGKILGAGLDVLEYEKSSFENMFAENNHLPTEFDYILKSSKVLLSPHIGGWTIESYRKLSDVLLKKILTAVKEGFIS